MFNRAGLGDGDQFRRRAPGREKSVAQTASPTGCRLGMAADDDRDAAVDGLRPAIDVVKVGEFAVIGGLVLAPKGAHGAHIIVRTGAPVVKWGADGIELLTHPADADAQQHAPA